MVASLRAADHDVARAIVALVHKAAGSSLARGPRPAVSVTKTGRGRGLIIVDPTIVPALPGCHLMQITAHEAFIALEPGQVSPTWRLPSSTDWRSPAWRAANASPCIPCGAPSSAGERTGASASIRGRSSSLKEPPDRPLDGTGSSFTMTRAVRHPVHERDSHVQSPRSGLVYSRAVGTGDRGT